MKFCGSRGMINQDLYNPWKRMFVPLPHTNLCFHFTVSLLSTKKMMLLTSDPLPSTKKRCPFLGSLLDLQDLAAEFETRPRFIGGYRF